MMGNEKLDERRESIKIDSLLKEELPQEPIRIMRTQAGIKLCYIATGLVGLVSLILIGYRP